jgi:antitoxin VapB
MHRKKIYTSAYILAKESIMLATAKLFQNGQSQAVRLPKEFRFENAKEVFVKKLNGAVILIPKSNQTAWNTLFDSLENFSDDFMTSRTEPAQEREELF